MKTLRLFLLALPAFAQQTPVVGLGNLAHPVESLEKTVPFYRDVLGLPLNGNPLAAKPQALDADISRFTGTQGASFRAAIFTIPNAGFGWELTEFTGVPHKADTFAIQDPGATTLVLRVRDLAAMLNRLKTAGATIVSISGTPQNNEIVVRDPDGFFVELQQPQTTPADATSDILGASINISVEDTDKSVKFYREAFGYNARPSSAWGTNAAVLQLIGLKQGEWRITHGVIPGFTTDFALIEYRGNPRAKRALGAADPGEPEFTMVVRDLDVAVAQWKAAGGTVVTSGDTPVKRAGGLGNVFVRDINGVMWELFTRPTPVAKQ